MACERAKAALRHAIPHRAEIQCDFVEDGQMPRYITVAAAQLGPIARSDSREAVVNRLIRLLEHAMRLGADIIVYPEAALTAFFPHWWIETEAELDSYFEREMPNAATQPLFDAARRLGVGF